MIVTGTDTGVGKTVVTAAIAAAALAKGLRVAVLKPAQTGDDDDARDIARLSGAATRTLVSYPDPLAPYTAARVAGLPALRMADVVAEAGRTEADLLLVEGAGGLLVQLGEDGWTAADLCAALAAEPVVVARAALGTLNHTALTLEALERRGLGGRVVIGAMPGERKLVHETNLHDLTVLTGGLAGIVPEGAPVLPGFAEAAPGWLSPGLYGTW
ncbi:dethiobiotin synthase [Actinorhabdospora filicis]|uniref:dethiobiotin synthase n=1 Tax=Actinorhabdospora filicis TaxID=1785913 RepID=UPI002557BBBF|nr:dethiobiotin synthase [Actinorhabdospora filicis]